MTPRRELRRMVFTGGLGLALFSALFSLAARRGLWPELPPGALHNTDLVAGLIGGVALFVLLVRVKRKT